MLNPHGIFQKAGPADFAEEFLRKKGWLVRELRRLLYWKENYYQFVGTHYQRIPDEELKSYIVRWLQSHPELRSSATSHMVNNILLNIRGIAQLADSTELQSWIGPAEIRQPNHISMSNGIVDLGKLIEGSKDILREHSPKFFTLASLPYSFDSSASCPHWLRFLEQVLPNQEIRQFIQEWFGYNLIFETALCKFVLYYGEGANGKSVACLVQRELLGEKNVSSVGLESFNPTRTFPMAATVGKLANIVEELGEIDKAAEGILKQFVGGSQMSAEEKHKTPFQFYPTARLTFATNVLPRFADRSEGLWRRLVLIPFGVRITDERKQKREYLDPKFWRYEMPGIFNWSIQGLIRLKDRGYFLEPKACREAKAAFRRDANPAKTFLQEHYQEANVGSITGQLIYREYCEYVRGNGQQPLGAPQFGQELARVFPNAQKSENAIRQPGGQRSHVWYGIKPRVDEEPAGTGDTDFETFR